MSEVPGRGEPNPKPLHSRGIEEHINDPQEGGGSPHSGRQPESREKGIYDTHVQLRRHAERLANQDNPILPAYLDGRRYFAAEWIAPKKEVLHGWDNFAELTFDMANLLSKPDNPAIPEHDIAAYDQDENVGKHLPADEWEEEVTELLEDRGLADKIPQFQEDMQQYRNSVKAIVQEWRESGLL